MAVNRFTNGAGGNTWNTAGNWSQGTIPTSSDGHVTTFDATSPNCTMGANRSCNNIDFTGYTNTLTMSTNTLTVAGNVTLDTGMIISGSGSMIISAASTITSNGKTWPNALVFGGITTVKTLVGDFTINGILSTNTSGITVNKTTAEKLILNGGTTANLGSSGTATVSFTGGTWNGSTIQNDIEFNGNVTISGSVNALSAGKTLTYISGTITTTGSTVNFPTGAYTINSNGIVFNNVTFNANPTITNNSLLTVSGTLLCDGSNFFVFQGTHGFTCSTLQLNGTGASSITLKEGVTYTVTGSLLCYTTRNGVSLLFTSAHASTKANLILVNPSECNVLANFTRIDASGGRTINTFNGTVTDCVNVREFHDEQVISKLL